MAKGNRRTPSEPSRIVDVARHAGVSAQTVSNVLNGRTGFTEATRLRVTAAVDELGYRPNRTARSLRLQRSMQLGFHLSGAQLDPRNPFSLSFLRALVRVADQSGYQVVVFTQQDDDPHGFQDLVARGGVDGFILTDCAVDDPRPRLLAGNGVPFAVFGRTASDLPQTWVDIDNAESIIAMVDYLVDNGHRQFGYVGNAGTEHWTVERREGVRSRLAQHGIRISDSSMVAGTPDSVRPGVRRLLTRKTRPSALITGSDSLAVTAFNVASSLGLKVGTDVAITGFDGGPLQGMLEPRLTTVIIPVEDIAAALVERLIREVQGSTAGEPGIFVPTTLGLGASA